MTILVTGSTGTIGARIVEVLHGAGAPVRAMARDPSKGKFPAGVETAAGDLGDPEAVRAALKGVRTLFLLNAVVPDELTQALMVLGLAREAGIERIIYFSVLKAESSSDVPHFAGKFAAERMLAERGMAATVLRPAYFMQNDAHLRQPIAEQGVYPMPVGARGVAMVDAEDIAGVAAAELRRRDAAEEPLPREVVEIPGPEALTGEGIAAAWAEALGRAVRYAGDDLDAYERASAGKMPGWMAYDMRRMFGRFQEEGMTAAAGAGERVEAILGRKRRRYRDFAAETAARWKG